MDGLQSSSKGEKSKSSQGPPQPGLLKKASSTPVISDEHDSGPKKLLVLFFKNDKVLHKVDRIERKKCIIYYNM